MCIDALTSHSCSVVAAAVAAVAVVAVFLILWCRESSVCGSGLVAAAVLVLALILGFALPACQLFGDHLMYVLFHRLAVSFMRFRLLNSILMFVIILPVLVCFNLWQSLLVISLSGGLLLFSLQF